jgi:hypothetical protein
MLNHKLNARGGFTPDAITPEQVLRHPRSAQGRNGGTGTVPSFIVPASWISYQRKGILQTLKNKKNLSVSY